MGRPKAEDVLQDLAAKKIREAIREVRALKGLTNKGIAKVLRWTVRQVTGALVDSSKLRAVKAAKILEALCAMKPQKREAQEVIRSAISLLTATVGPRPPMPAVLMPSTEIGVFADFIADIVARSPGIGEKRREAISRQLRVALGHRKSRLTKNFVNLCIGRFAGTDAIDYKTVLTAFGYADIYTGFFSMRKGNQ